MDKQQTFHTVELSISWVFESLKISLLTRLRERTNYRNYTMYLAIVVKSLARCALWAMFKLNQYITQANEKHMCKIFLNQYI